MKEIKDKARKSLDTLEEIIFVYMMFVLFIIGIALLASEPKIFVPIFVISAIIVFVDRFKNKKKEK